MLDKIKTLVKNKKFLIPVIAAVLIIATVVCVHFATGNNEYKVTFFSDTDIVLKVDNVKKNNSAEPPREPQMTYGKIFKSWDKDFSSVRKNLKIHPVCESVIDKSNVFSMSGAYGKTGETVFVPLQLNGNVCLSGFDITAEYDADALTLVSYFDSDEAVMINDETPGALKINYISAKNTTADVDICKLKFNVNAKKGDYPIKITVNSIYAFEDSDDLSNDKLYAPDSNVIDGTVYVIS